MTFCLVKRLQDDNVIYAEFTFCMANSTCDTNMGHTIHIFEIIFFFFFFFLAGQHYKVGFFCPPVCGRWAGAHFWPMANKSVSLIPHLRNSR